MKACLILNWEHEYTMIHQDAVYFSKFSKVWGEEFSSYFSIRQKEEVTLPDLTVCRAVAFSQLGDRVFYLVCDGKDYSIINRNGLAIEGEDDRIKFFEAIFE